MLRCHPVRIPFALYAFALFVRAALFGLFPDAAYPDSYYYVDVARALHAGHGFNVDFIYSFLDVGSRIPADPHLPVASNGFWMPLASIVQLPTLFLLGPTTLASAIPFVLIGALAAPLTWLVAREAGCGSRVAIAAAFAVAVPGAASLYMAQPDNFSLFQPIATAALWFTARGLKGHRRSFALAGMLVGLATLSRNDGVLLGLVVGAAFLWDRWRSWRSSGTRPPKIPWRYGLACFGLFILVMGPWYLRQLAVFGSLAPSSTTTLLVRSYQDTNCVTCGLSLGYFLDQGPGSLLASRVVGIVDAIAIFCLLLVPVVLVPLAAAGAWARRRTVEFGPFLAYALLLFGATGLLFAAYVPYGTFMHSAVALVPYAYILAFEGAIVASHWAVRHRPSWTEEGAARLFLVVGAASSVITAAGFATTVLPSWSADRDNRVAAGRSLDGAGVPETDLLLSADPAGLEYFTGRGGVVTPNDSLEVVHQVAVDYHIRWLILERAHIVDPLVPILESKARPAWIGAPVFIVPNSAPATGNTATDAAPALAVYPVCTQAGDTRCDRLVRAGSSS